MIKSTTSTSLALTFLGCLVAGPSSANLLENPGFELPDLVPPANQAPGADGWTTFNTAGVRTIFQNSGDQSLRLAPNAPTGTGTGIARQEFPASANEVFSFSSFLFHPSSDPITGPRTAELRIQWLNASNTLINQVVLEVINEDTPTDVWISVELEDFQLPDNPNITTVRPSLFVANNSSTVASSGAAFFDDVSFVREATSTPLLGDADGDGDVDGDDLIAVQTEFGSTGTPPLLGDADNDGDVDGDDLIAVQTEFGNVAPATAVPEPAAILLFLAAGLGIVGRRRRMG